jgi:hypothetical protein
MRSAPLTSPPPSAPRAGIEVLVFTLLVLAALSPLGIVFGMFQAGILKNPTTDVAIVGFCCSVGFWVGAVFAGKYLFHMSSTARTYVAALCLIALIVWRIAETTSLPPGFDL